LRGVTSQVSLAVAFLMGFLRVIDKKREKREGR
jgi:hypothetical protein